MRAQVGCMSIRKKGRHEDHSAVRSGNVAVGLSALLLATAIARRVPLLARLNVPTAVIGGVLVAVFVALLHQFSGTTVQFASRLTDFLLLVFFTTVGLSAKFSALKRGGRPLLILCVVTVILLIAQNIVGILLAWSVGAHPFFGIADRKRFVCRRAWDRGSVGEGKPRQSDSRVRRKSRWRQRRSRSSSVPSCRVPSPVG